MRQIKAPPAPLFRVLKCECAFAGAESLQDCRSHCPRPVRTDLMRTLKRPLTQFFFLILLFLSGVFGASADTESNLRYSAIPFQTLSIEHGLPQVSVTAIHQDNTGFMWFGTQDGLGRFDGYNFKVFHHKKDDPKSLSRDYIDVIREDSAGHLWIGTRGGDLNEFDPLTETFTRHQLKTGTVGRSSASDIRSLLLRDNKIYAGTLDGLYLFDTQTQHKQQIQLPVQDEQQNVVYDLLENDDGSILISTAAGLFMLDPNTLAVTDLNHVLYEGLDDLQPSTRAIYRDRQGNLWIATGSNGVMVMDKEGRRRQHFMPDPNAPDSLAYWSASAFQQDVWGNIWIASAGGLNLYLSSQQQMIRLTNERHRIPGTRDQSFSALYSDNTDVIWIGTNVGGVSRFSPHHARIARLDPASDINALDQRVLGLFETKAGDLLTGSGNGLMLRRAGKDRFELVPSPELQTTGKSTVYGVTQSRDKTIWVGSNSGLQRLPEGAQQLLPSEQSSPYYFVSILEDSDGSLWMGFPNKLNRYDPQTRAVIASVDIPHAFSIIELEPGTLAVGGLKGLYLVDSNKAQVKAELGGGIHDFTSASYLAQARDGSIWMGTQGSGLYHIRLGLNGTFEDAQIRSFTTDDGLASNAIGGIIEGENGDIWLSTTRGISRIEPDTGSVHNFSAKDGAFAGGYFIGSALRDREGLIYFGGINGISIFSPAWNIQDPYVPEVYFTELRLNNRPSDLIQIDTGKSPLKQPIHLTEQIAIEPEWSIMSIGFSAKYYAHPEKTLYRYKLDGFDEEWFTTDASHRTATYSNLPPGRYNFMVKAANADGRWNKRATSLEIIIKPHWYQTTWAQLLIPVLIVGLIYALMRLRFATIIRRNKQLEDHAAKHNAALVHANTELDKLARTDMLTGLLNRRAFIEQFDSLSGSPYHRGMDCAVALLDIDKFKQFNDDYGHDCGDHVLQSIALILKQSIRKQDCVARWGGEEFVIMFPNTSVSDAQKVLEELRSQVEQTSFEWQGETLFITITAGIGGDHGCQSLDACLKPIDDALYHGKANGRNQVVVANDIMI